MKIDLILYSSSADKNRPIDRRAKGYRDSFENDIPKDGESIRHENVLIKEIKLA